MILRQKIKSPVPQQMLWVAEYSNGTYLSEFDLQTQKPNQFNAIRRQDVIRFGLVGIDVPVYYEVFGGFFNIAGRGIQAKYVTQDGKEYFLIGHNKPYNNIIQFKRGESELNLLQPKHDSVIWGKNAGEVVEHSFGYKANISVEDVNFEFEALCRIPYQQPVLMTFKLTADKDLNGALVILRNSTEVASIDAPLEVGIQGETSWVVK
ncbi:hypothetical protein [Bacillus horti]|uniref:Uncharacterized protein n=1 Tax=Caldalkalibacillus horti TaxID=77523 RepID=A0ABT9VW87_9BACI|nr:hypothetical protein [Bacillus horti]MDQ0165155.1 hypothetical protein [Bacillus horti]